MSVWDTGVEGVLAEGRALLLFRIAQACHMGAVQAVFPLVQWRVMPGGGAWAAVVFAHEYDGRLARRHLLQLDVAATHVMLRYLGCSTATEQHYAVCVPKDSTRFLLSLFHGQTLSVSYGPCVGADTVHDILLMEREEDCDAVLAAVPTSSRARVPRHDYAHSVVVTVPASGCSLADLHLLAYNAGVDPRALEELHMVDASGTLHWPAPRVCVHRVRVVAAHPLGKDDSSHPDETKLPSSDCQ